MRVRLLIAILPFFLHVAAIGQAVEFSHPSGFYSRPFSLHLRAVDVNPDSAYIIRYTFNGSAPTETSQAYTRPVRLNDACRSQSSIFRLQNSPDAQWQPPKSVERIVVVRAAIFDKAGQQLSEVASASFVIRRMLKRKISLPVLSLSVDSAALFDPDTGIFVPGVSFDPKRPGSTGNYMKRGREWERAVNITYIPHEGSPFSVDGGLRIHGGSQRTLSQKGLSLYARAEYGNKFIDHPFFSDRDLVRYKRLALRPWCASWSGTGIEDWLCQQIAVPLRCDRLAARPVALFLNGEYWGIYFIQEKADEHYVEAVHGVDDSEVHLIGQWGDEIEHGSPDRWMALADWLAQADLSADSNYQYLSTQVDIEAMADYMLLQMFVANVDWPSNNVRYWSAYDFPWRWIFYDADAAFAAGHDPREMMEHVTCNDSSQVYPSSPRASLVFRRLMENEGFRRKMKVRLEELQATAFSPAVVLPLLDVASDAVEDEVPYQLARFTSGMTPEMWRKAVADMGVRMADHASTLGAAFAEFFPIVPAVASLALSPDEGALVCEATDGFEAPLTVYDIYGRPAFSQTVTLAQGANAIALPRLPAGVYFVSLGRGGATVRWRVA